MIGQSYKSKTIALQLSQSCRRRPFGPEHRQRMHDRVLNRTKAPKIDPIQLMVNDSKWASRKPLTGSSIHNAADD